MPEHPILPADRYLASLLGLTEEQYAYFQSEVRRRAREQPAPAVVAGLEVLTIVAIAASLLSVGFAIAASFFKPRATEPGRLVQRDRTQDPIVGNQRFAPRFGIDGGQDVVRLGATVPLIYTLRETVSGTVYGGLRVNTPLLWAQIYSLGSSQMLRALFLLGEGTIDSIDTRNFALGNNSLGAYDLLSSTANERAARLTIYHSASGGRLASAARIAGRTPERDPGNAVNAGAADVFQTRSVGNNWAPDFCAVVRPSTGTSFGLYAPCGNNLGFKVNPVVRPAVRPRLKPVGNKGDSVLQCDPDGSSLVQRQKYEAFFSTRSGFLKEGGLPDLGTVAVDTELVYRLSRSCEPLDDPFLVDVEEDGDTSTWTVAKSVNSRPRVYQRNSNQTEISINWENLLTVSSPPAVGTDTETLEVTVTFDYLGDKLNSNTDSLVDVLGNASRGQYKVVYEVTISRDDEDIDAEFEIQIEKQTRSNYSGSNDPSTNVVAVTEGSVTSFYSFDMDVDQDSRQDGSPPSGTLRATIVFPVKKLNASSENARDVATAVANRQKSWDDTLVTGELFKLGSALLVCTARDPSNAVFVSDVDTDSPGSGTTIDAKFRVVRSGTAATYTDSVLTRLGKTSTSGKVATETPHLFRCAIATFVTSRRCRVVEIGLRSTMGIRMSGLCNFKDAPSYYLTDGRACKFKENDKVKKGRRLILEEVRSNTLTTAEERYSFFRVFYRNPDTNDGFTAISDVFGVRGITQQAAFNYLRFVMPTEQHWEFRFEPLSGWEIRSNTATGDLKVIDAALSSTISGTSGPITWYSNGLTVPRTRDQFSLNATVRGDNIDGDLPRIDGNNYVDSWGKLAEMFCYEEIQSSAGGSPEHEIIYVNEIVQNPVTPVYDNLALIGLNISSSVEWQQFSQFSTYVLGGVRCRRLRNSLSLGPTHLFPDILLDLLTNTVYGRGDTINDNLIDLDSFQAAAEWCYSRKYFYDGLLSNRANLRQWAADVAASHLLIFGESDGRFYLRQAFQLTPIAVKGIFTAGNIVENSFQLQYLDPEDREPIQVSIKYREERASNNIVNLGIFPVERELRIREAGASDTDPTESLDVSDYCTNRNHAVDVAKYLIRMRRIPTHTIKFTTTYQGVLAQLSPSDYIQVYMDVTQYDEFNNGVVTAEGGLVSTKPLASGSYSVIAWNGDNATPPSTTQLVVSGTQATPKGIVFTLNTSESVKRTYQIERISPEENGSFTIEAVHMPTNSSSILKLAEGFDDPSNWIIEG